MPDTPGRSAIGAGSTERVGKTGASRVVTSGRAAVEDVTGTEGLGTATSGPRPAPAGIEASGDAIVACGTADAATRGSDKKPTGAGIVVAFEDCAGTCAAGGWLAGRADDVRIVDIGARP
ncbi:MAG TPA: hypothetical protein VG757_14550 [Devosia sp.]|nr:hypothetical protein [Devosia sp.]